MKLLARCVNLAPWLSGGGALPNGGAAANGGESFTPAQQGDPLSIVLFVQGLLEVTSAALGRRDAFLATFYPDNALLMVALIAILLIQGWRVTRERVEMKPRHDGKVGTQAFNPSLLVEDFPH